MKTQTVTPRTTAPKSTAERMRAHRARNRGLSLTLQHPAAVFALAALQEFGYQETQRQVIEAALIRAALDYLPDRPLAKLRKLCKYPAANATGSHSLDYKVADECAKGAR